MPAKIDRANYYSYVLESINNSHAQEMDEFKNFKEKKTKIAKRTIIIAISFSSFFFIVYTLIFTAILDKISILASNNYYEYGKLVSTNYIAINNGIGVMVNFIYTIIIWFCVVYFVKRK